jgi:hypothetical protein
MLTVVLLNQSIAQLANNANWLLLLILANLRVLGINDLNIFLVL